MKGFSYLIIGAGGTGGPIGAYLTKAGFDTKLIARGKHLLAMQEQGLLLETGFAGNERVPVSAYDMESYLKKLAEASLQRPDVIFVCVKGYSLEETIPFIRAAAKPETVVIPILNIYGTGRRLQAALPELCVTDGCIYVSANISEPGVLKLHGSIFRIVYGIPGRPADDARLLQVAADLERAGIVPVYSAQIEKDAMAKFSYVSAQAACGLYFHAEAGQMQLRGGAAEAESGTSAANWETEPRAMFIELCREIEELAAAEGIRYETPLWETNLRILDGLAPTASTSMQRDIYAGKQSEIDGLIYEVVRLADRYGLKLPAYRKAAEKFRAEKIK